MLCTAPISPHAHVECTHHIRSTPQQTFIFVKLVSTFAVLEYSRVESSLVIGVSVEKKRIFVHIFLAHLQRTDITLLHQNAKDDRYGTLHNRTRERAHALGFGCIDVNLHSTGYEPSSQQVLIKMVRCSLPGETSRRQLFRGRRLNNRRGILPTFRKYRQELTSKKYMLKLRLRLFDATVSPTLCYAAGTWSPSREHERMIQSTQRKMLRLIIQTKRKYKKN